MHEGLPSHLNLSHHSQNHKEAGGEEELITQRLRDEPLSLRRIRVPVLVREWGLRQ
jgi:hypothetical protein